MRFMYRYVIQLKARFQMSVAQNAQNAQSAQDAQNAQNLLLGVKKMG